MKTDLHGANSPSHLEHVMLLLAKFDSILSHEHKSAEFGLIVLKINSVFLEFYQSVHSRDRNIVDSHLALVPAAHRESVLQLVERKHVNSPTAVFFKG